MTKKRKAPGSTEPRLADFGREHYVSSKGLAAVLQKVSQDGLPGALSSTSVRRDIAKVASEVTPFGPIVYTKEVEEVTLGLQNPLAFMWSAARKSVGFRRFLTSCAKEGRLQLILYSDGITPGNEMRRIARKYEALYWSFKNFGQAVLSTDIAWFTALCVRSEMAHKITGQMSHVYKIVLQSLFGTSTGDRDLRSGVTLERNGKINGRGII